MRLPRLSEQQPPLITYQIENGETVVDAVCEAFGAVGLDVYDQGTTIEDWTKRCQIDLSMLDSEHPCRVSIIIWDHPVVVTPDAIQIYEHV